MSLVLAGALISIALNPLLFAGVEPLRSWILKRSALARRLEQRGDPYAELPMTTERKYLEGQVVLVGYGRVGRRIARAMQARGIPFVVADAEPRARRRPCARRASRRSRATRPTRPC